MEVTEEISGQTNHSDHRETASDLGFHQPRSSSIVDPDPATSDLVLANDGGISEKFARLAVKEVEEEALKSESDGREERETVEKDLKENSDKEEEEDGDERARKSESEETAEGDVEVTVEDLSGEGVGDRSESESDEGDDNDQEGEEKKSEVEDENVNEVISGSDDPEKIDDRSAAKKHHYPVRPEAEDCSFYLKTGTCKFGPNCKFNHPLRKKPHYHHQASRERTKDREESSERSGQSECKYYLRSGGCKYGKACKYNHTRVKTSAIAPVVEFNFAGLPIRLGEKECPYYMRTGTCKYGVHCRFNHPDPTDAVGSDASTGYGNGGPVSLQGSSQSAITSWSSSRPLNETPPPPPPPPAPYVPMMIPPTPVVPSPNTEWNGYQAPVYLPPDRNLPPPSAYSMNNPSSEANIYKPHLPHKQLEDYPERPGQPDCSYFLKTGDCKFKSNCKYHHPKNRASVKPPCALSDKGLPLRPDQNICTHFSRYGICKFGPACKYDHSPAKIALSISGVDNQQAFGHSSTMEGSGMIRSGSRNELAIQQSV